MRVFTHGSNVNFQESAREMLLPDLARYIHSFSFDAQANLFGTISLEREEIRVYGHAVAMDIDEQAEQFRFVYQLPETGEKQVLTYLLDHFQISHEAVFDVIENEQSVRYQAVYFTFEHSEEEETYFLAATQPVSEPLAYVAEFWRVTEAIGRDIDFAISGCSAFDLNRKLRAERDSSVN
ncbi:hypothetical protein SAMN05444392_103156 [Seinonella peptonophila]|uniref:Uncharacterized protein n=1 Tax=Seinonella peptonophila TaxID=112248 RepID=A0A1M4WCW9_9BACL|nr:hypothetical protein [Seinonella peptonophila]SHE79000.1 hypothetical protein SAMN05444392_103156 [Seinonella peptonophila]